MRPRTIADYEWALSYHLLPFFAKHALSASKALSEWKAMRRVSDGPVLATRTGNRQTVTNIDHRLKVAIRRANERLSERGMEPISER